jgi:hypothetical protein
VASVDAQGLVTARADGTATITGSVGDASAAVSVTVRQTGFAVEVTPANRTLTFIRDVATFRATVRDALGNALGGAQAVQWSTSAAGVATVDAQGVVRAAGNGTALITASAGSLQGNASVLVEQAPASIQVSPGESTLASVGATVRLTASVVDAGGTLLAPQPTVGWSSGDESVATVASDGTVTARGVGNATITATAGSVVGSATVAVAQGAGVASIQVTPAATTLAALGATVNLTAVARNGSGQVATPAPAFTWVSSAPAVATVNAAGVVTAVGNGAATITASAAGVSGAASVQVQQVPVALSVTPAAPVLTQVGATQQFQRVMVDANGQPVTSVAQPTVAWQSSNVAVATINANGLATATGPGATTITATGNGLSGSATLTVTQNLASVTVSPDSAGVGVGGTRQFSATARDAGGQPLATQPTFTWSSTNPGVAPVSATGLATGVSAGTVTIIAAAGTVQGTAKLVVAAAGPSITLTPSVLNTSATAGQSPGPQTFRITNTGGGTLNWTATPDASWMSLSRTSGSLAAGASDSVTVSYSVSNVAAGVYTGAIAVAAQGATNSPVNLVVNLTLTAPAAPTLRHRWTFSETGGAGTTLVDDVGDADATILDVGTQNATVGGGQVTLAGGDVNQADFVAIPEGVLSSLGNATIEVWATQISVKRWARIFDFGSGTSNYLFMSWTRSEDLDTDRVEWFGPANVTTDFLMAPYTLGSEFQIVMTVTEGAGSGGATVVRLYRDGVLRGSLETTNRLSDLQDTFNHLGRSQYLNDEVANASYHELRIYQGAMTDAQVAARFAEGPVADKGAAPVTGTVRGVVTLEGAPLAGVTVTLDGPKSSSAAPQRSADGPAAAPVSVVSDASGVFVFANVQAGTYDLYVAPPLPTGVAFPTPQVQVVVATQGQVVTQDFAGIRARESTVAGTVTTGGAPMPGVTVRITGPEGPFTAVTNGAGQYTFTGLLHGTWTAQVTGVFRAAYDWSPNPPSKSVVVAAGGSATADFQATSRGGVLFSPGLSVQSDLNGHEPFILMLTVGSVRIHILEGNRVVMYNDEPGTKWVNLEGTMAADGSITASGVGTVAGFANVDVVFSGKLNITTTDILVSVTGTLTVDPTNDQLPGNPRNPAVYNMNATPVITAAPPRGGR